MTKVLITRTVLVKGEYLDAGSEADLDKELAKALIKKGSARVPTVVVEKADDVEAEDQRIIDAAKDTAAQIVDGAKDVAEQIKSGATTKAVEITDAAKTKADEIIAKAKEKADAQK